EGLLVDFNAELKLYRIFVPSSKVAESEHSLCMGRLPRQATKSLRHNLIQMTTLCTRATTRKFPTLRMLLLYTIHENLKITQFDVQGAFLHAPLSEEEVFIKTPKGVNQKTPYLKLKKLLYGLKQSPKNWYETMAVWLNSMGFYESNCNLSGFEVWRDGEKEKREEFQEKVERGARLLVLWGQPEVVIRGKGSDSMS
ncbi:hypothetical protein VP01_1867g2, partial [Puccinia sorghi]